MKNQKYQDEIREILKIQKLLNFISFSFNTIKNEIERINVVTHHKNYLTFDANDFHISIKLYLY